MCTAGMAEREFDMGAPKSSGWFAGIAAVLLVAAPQAAHAYVSGGDPHLWQNLEKKPVPRTPISGQPWDRAPGGLPAIPWTGGPGVEPVRGDGPTAPIPEPGTLTLTSLGLLAIGAAMRKRRGAEAPTRSGAR
jgi:hypothetical protein